MRTRVIWHRRDLRLTDNVLYRVDAKTVVIPLYVFDPKDFLAQLSCADGNHNVAKMGPFAARFLIESVSDLRANLGKLGQRLHVRTGEPRQVLPSFVQELLASGVSTDIEIVWHDEAGTDEIAEAAAVRASVSKLRSSMGGKSVNCSSFWGTTLWHPCDLSVYKPSGKGSAGQEVDTTCKAWEQIKQQGVQSFRRRAKQSSLREPTAAPNSFAQAAFGDVPEGTIPSITDLVTPCPLFGMTADEVGQIVHVAQQNFDSRSAHPFRGGENAGLEHLHAFVRGPAEFCSREGGGDAGGGVDSSAKMSAYLAFGCLSPRTIHCVCKARRDGKADWLPENMEMRDFWIFYALAHGKQLFERDGNGPANLPPEHWRPHSAAIWKRWLLGTTGLPLLDATMKELLSTGYTSNRCRQIPVSVLANDLRLDWRMGAELYQWLLVDHDVGPNWGNWRYFAGTGCDPKKRHYKAISQGLRYDAEASFIKMWLPELRELSAREAHLIPVRKEGSTTSDKVVWPEAIVDAWKQLSWDDQKNLGTRTSNYETAEDRRDDRRTYRNDQKGKGKGKSNNRMHVSTAEGKSAYRTHVESTCRSAAGSEPARRRWQARAAA